MKTIKKILIPVDFSGNSNELIQRAVNFANYNNSEVLLLHVYNRPLLKIKMHKNRIFEKGILNRFENVLLNWTKKRTEAKFDALLKDISNVYDIRFTIIKEIGLLTDAIKRVVRQYDVDLVFIGTKGGPQNKTLWHSKAAKLTNKLHVPVLIFPYKFKVESNAAIAFAYDLKRIDDLNKLNIVKSFSSFFSAKVYFFSVGNRDQLSPEESKNLELLKSHFEGYHPEFHQVVCNDVGKGILDFTKSNKILLLTILHRSRSAIKNLFHESIAKKVAAKSDVPVLSIGDYK